MAKQMVYDDEARQPLAAGVSKLARAVAATLGPRGRNAVLDKGWGAPKVTKDGVTVAEDIDLEDGANPLGFFALGRVPPAAPRPGRPWRNGVMPAARSACDTWVLCASIDEVMEMPIAAPMLRARFCTAVASPNTSTTKPGRPSPSLLTSR